MKRIILLIISFGILISAMAQSPIFYGGLKLGMTLSEVKQVISNNGKTLITQKSSNGGTYYLVEQPKIAGVTFQTLTLNFTGNKLTRANFFSREGAGGLPSAPRFDMVRQLAGAYRADFNSLLAGLQSKYGQPVSSSGDECYWNYNGYVIELMYSFTDEMDIYDNRQSDARVSLEYKKPDISDL